MVDGTSPARPPSPSPALPAATRRDFESTAMSTKESADRLRVKAAAQFKKKLDADRAVADWEKAQQAEAAKTARLRALRLAKEAADALNPPVKEPKKPAKKAAVKKNATA